jgi:hypothetical protein
MHAIDRKIAYNLSLDRKQSLIICASHNPRNGEQILPFEDSVPFQSLGPAVGNWHG